MGSRELSLSWWCVRAAVCYVRFRLVLKAVHTELFYRLARMQPRLRKERDGCSVFPRKGHIRAQFPEFYHRFFGFPHACDSAPG